MIQRGRVRAAPAAAPPMSPRSRRAAPGRGAAARRARRRRSPRVRGRRARPPPPADRRECRDEDSARPRSPRACAPARRRRRRCRGRPSARRRRRAAPRTASRRSSCSRSPSRRRPAGRNRRARCDSRRRPRARNSSVLIAAAAVKSRVGRSSSIGTTRSSAPASAGDLVDGRAAGGKIRHHLRGDGLRIGRHAARGDAVIAGEHRDRDAIEPRRFASLPLRQPDREFFEAAEASRRLGQILLPARGGIRESPHRRRAGRDRRRGCRLDCRTACDSCKRCLWRRAGAHARTILRTSP